MPSKRTIALRFIGAILCVGCIGVLIMSFVAPREDEKGGRSRLGILLTVAIAGGAMAYKGKWPGSEDSTELTAKTDNATQPIDKPA
jgi:hypothetical protein